MDIENKKPATNEEAFQLGEVNSISISSERDSHTEHYNLFTAYSLTVSITGLFSTVSISFTYPLLAGGSPAIVWCWLIAGIGCLIISLSVSELVSAYPTSGGLYDACYHVYPRSISPVMRWIAGWVSILGQFAITASSEYGGAQLLLEAVSMGSGYKYVPTAAQYWAVTTSLLVFHGLIVCLPPQYVEKLTRSYIILHFGSLLAGAIALLITTNNKMDAEDVFTSVVTNSGWTPQGWAFLFGLLSASWSMTFYDGTAHLSEYIKKPATTVPWAISGGMLTVLILGFLYNIVLAFCLRDVEAIKNEALPISAIYYNSMGRAGGVCFTVLMFVIMNFVGVSVLQSTSNTIYSQAKDKMFPGSTRLFRYKHPLTGTPIFSVMLATIICILINLIGIGSSSTMNAIFNVTALAFDWYACIPIFGKILHPSLFERGPWHMGPFSKFVDVAAILWTAFVTVLFCMPYTIPVTLTNMNYAAVFLVFTIVAALAAWFCGMKRIFMT